MNTKLITYILSGFLLGIVKNSYSQCSVTVPSQGACSGCTNNPSGTITLSTNGASVCYSGSSTISTLTINGNNVTVYICGSITITNIGGNGTGVSIIVNAGKTLTITNQPGNFYAAPTYVNYGTLNLSSSWSNFYGGKLITTGASAVTNITGSLTLNGATVYMDGGIINISGTSTFNSGSYVCLNNNAIYNTVGIVNNANSVVSVGAGSSACISYTGNANISTNYLSSSILNVCRGPSVTGTSATSAAWGPHVFVNTGCDQYTCAIILPMVMGNFALSSSGSKVLLNWSTFSEQNSNVFEVQRSIDAINFSTIGTVAAAGNSATTKQYSFTDYSPVVGNNFYRIKLLSDDGNPSYSVVKEIEITLPDEMKVIVNNSQNNIKVIMPQNSSASTLRLVDMQGRILKTLKATGQEESVMIETANVFSGIYVIELISQQSHQSKQVFISSGK
ncbi:MAG TPA: T9SS type A sorting domain-containing protein [Puia sp.]|nr:T9SS type A sorting domain-containing protein [Puia sp.]